MRTISETLLSLFQQNKDMKFYIRFTDTPSADLVRKVSYHLSDVEAEGYVWNEYFNAYAFELPGLCAYELDVENVEEAIEKAGSFQQDIFDAQSELDSYCVLAGTYVTDCPEGDVINPTEILFIKKGKYYAE